MHELGIIFHIIDSVEEVGRENSLSKVSKVTLEIGEVSGVVDEYLGDCWKWASARSKLLDGSELEVEKLPAVTYCENCSEQYSTVKYGKICPNCSSDRTYLLTGNEVSIKEIEAC